MRANPPKVPVMAPPLILLDRVGAGIGAPAEGNGVKNNNVVVLSDNTEAPVAVNGVGGNVVVVKDFADERTRTSVDIGGVDGEISAPESDVVGALLEGV